MIKRLIRHSHYQNYTILRMRQIYLASAFLKCVNPDFYQKIVQGKHNEVRIQIMQNKMNLIGKKIDSQCQKSKQFHTKVAIVEENVDQQLSRVSRHIEVRTKKLRRGLVSIKKVIRKGQRDLQQKFESIKNGQKDLQQNFESIKLGMNKGHQESKINFESITKKIENLSSLEDKINVMHNILVQTHSFAYHNLKAQKIQHIPEQKE